MNPCEKILMFIGAIAIIVVIGSIILFLIQAIKELSHHLHLMHIVKHRFDKPPTAKCYCRDCKRWNKKTGACNKFEGWLTADSWYCWDAELRSDRQIEI